MLRVEGVRLDVLSLGCAVLVGSLMLAAETETLTLSPFGPPDPKHSEGCVSLDESGTVSVFHSRRPDGPGGYDLWISRRQGQIWAPPASAGPGVNSAEHEIDPALSADGTTLFFTRSVYGGATALAALGDIPDKKTDIYAARWRGGKWGQAEKLPAPLNLAASAEFRAVPSPDGKRLFFGSNRPGGLGGYDIYVSERTEGGWSVPVNLGAPLNGPGDEVDAAVAPHGRTLILAKRPKPSEGQRLMISHLRDGSWSAPADMGPRFNTGAGDGCPWLGYDGKSLYVNSSTRSILPSPLADPGQAVWAFTYSKGY